MTQPVRPTDEAPVSARWVLPVNAPAVPWARVADGAGTAIEHVRPEACDLPGHALLPPLVNAHTHLDLSAHTEPLAPGRPLPEWLPEVVRSRTGDSIEAIREGHDECRRAGTALIADVTTVDEPLPELTGRTALREYLGCDPDRWDTTAASAKRFLSANPSAGLSPHATYSVPVRLLRRLVDVAGSRPVMMHLAEDPAERSLLRDGSGPFRTMLEQLGVWRAGLFGGQTMSDVLAELLRAPRPIIAHGNDLSDAEIEQIAAHGNATVVWCPRTQLAFGQPRHPVLKLRRRGVRVAIGTDSRASTPTISMLDELRAAYHARPDIDPQDLLAMATTEGAAMLAADLPPHWSVHPLAEPDASDWPTALFGRRSSAF